MSTFIQFIDRLLIELLSPQCLVCSKFCDRNLCEECARFEKFKGRCLICGKETGAVSGNCGICRSSEFSLSGIQSVFYFSPVGQSILHRIKFGKEPIWLKLFDSVLLLDPHLLIPGDPWVVAVPMHWTRRIQRGFNQSELLAQRLAKNQGLRFGKNTLKKKRRTKPQSRLSHALRRSNLRNTFKAKFPSEIPDTVILVDDVMTTGSTLKACAKALRKAGVREVWGWTLFRAEKTLKASP